MPRLLCHTLDGSTRILTTTTSVVQRDTLWRRVHERQEARGIWDLVGPDGTVLMSYNQTAAKGLEAITLPKEPCTLVAACLDIELLCQQGRYLVCSWKLAPEQMRRKTRHQARRWKRAPRRPTPILASRQGGLRDLRLPKKHGGRFKNKNNQCTVLSEPYR